MRIIDTPGIGDTRGIEQDNENFENILHFISRFDKLHAICILLKPNNSRLTVMFTFCIKHLLSRLEKSAANNIIFIFTNTRSTFYRPGNTKPALEKLLSDIKSSTEISIPLNHTNTFCMDNEAYRFLVSVKKGIIFTEEEKKDFKGSWNRSVNECLRLIKYIVGDDKEKGLIPHNVQNTLSVNEARRVIILLSKPLADITQSVQDNIQIMEKHRKNIRDSRDNHKSLENQLYIPVVDLNMIELPYPVTVCSAQKCLEIITVG